MADARRMEPLSRDEALRLLGSVALGRVVFTQFALPAIRPVYHLVDGDQIIVRAHLGGDIAAATEPEPGMVVAYQADLIDAASHLGWSVTVVGRARRLAASPGESRYRQLLRPWAAGSPDAIIAIQPDIVDGFRLVQGHG
jgi:hypothetical protein